MVPHGTPMDFLPFTGARRYVACTDVIFDRYDPSTFHPYDLPSTNPIPTQYLQMYQRPTDQTFFPPPPVWEDVLQNQLEDLRKILPCPANGISKNTFCDDIWPIIFSTMSLPEILDFQTVSKDCLEIIQNQDELWKLHTLSYCENFSTFNLGLSIKAFPNWYSKFKVVYFGVKNAGKLGTVIDIGSAQIKTLTYRGGPFVGAQNLELQVLDSVYKFREQAPDGFGRFFPTPTSPFQMLLPYDPDSIILGESAKEGFPIIRTETQIIEKVCCSLSPHLRIGCLLLEPMEPIPTFGQLHPFEMRFIEASVATVCAFNRSSGVVISLGHSKAWIQKVENYKPGICLVNKIQEGQSIQDMLKPMVQEFLQNDPTDGDKAERFYEFCCIGGPFDEKAVEVLSTILQETTPNFSIISSPEIRLCAPLLGAFLAPIRNPQISSPFGGKHLLNAPEDKLHIPPADYFARPGGLILGTRN